MQQAEEKDGRHGRYMVAANNLLIDNLNCFQFLIFSRNFIVAYCVGISIATFSTASRRKEGKKSRHIFPLWNCVIFLRMTLCFGFAVAAKSFHL